MGVEINVTKLPLKNPLVKLTVLHSLLWHLFNYCLAELLGILHSVNYVLIDKLKENAGLFERQAKRLHHNSRLQHHKLRIILAVIVTLIVIFLVLVLAGKGYQAILCCIICCCILHFYYTKINH